MKNHADTWVEAFRKYNIDFPAKEAYLNEGSTGEATIKKAIREIEGREATQEEIEGIYAEKTRLMNSVPNAEIIPGMQELIREIRSKNIKIIVVTGSKQPVLLDRLRYDFGVEKQNIVSGYDVKHGKPHPEPYLIALKKANCKPSDAVVIENAPLGIKSAVDAGIYTIAINTGPLEKSILKKAGADKVFDTTDQLQKFVHNLLTTDR
jgi:HAD superfamily hydrolase (TIGR01509 family)